MEFALVTSYSPHLEDHNKDAEIYIIFKRLENGTWEVVNRFHCYFNSFNEKEFFESFHFKGYKQETIKENEIRFYKDCVAFLHATFFEGEILAQSEIESKRKLSENKIVEIVEKFLVINNKDFLKESLKLFKEKI